jgi:hypothetical protein
MSEDDQHDPGEKSGTGAVRWPRHLTHGRFCKTTNVSRTRATTAVAYHRDNHNPLIALIAKSS